VRGLARKSVRGHRGSFLAEGARVVEEALAGRWRVTDIVATLSAGEDVERWRSRGLLDSVAVSVTDDRTFRTLAESVHPQGVLAVVEERRAELARLHAEGPALVLDRVQDPGNAGTLLRSLHAAGGTAVLALVGTVDLFNPKAVRASAGSLFHLEVATQVATGAALDWLESERRPLFALDQSGDSIFADSFPVPERFVLAVGNEGAGLAEPLLERAARRLAIPMAPRVDSLNAAVAGSIALFELVRRGSGIDRGAGLS
jgi:TrmH family RNA methyltransferase